MDIASKTKPGCTSLRVRLLISWLVFIALMMSLTDLGLTFLFERSIIRRTQSELVADSRQIFRGMEARGGGAVEIVRKPTDPQFDIVFGGRYWQVTEGGRVLARSASLGEASLAVPPHTGERRTLRLDGPGQQRLIAVVETVRVPSVSPDMTQRVTIASAVDISEIDGDIGKFSSDLHLSLGMLSVILLLGAWWHSRIVLRPFEALRNDVAAVREGSALRIGGGYPDELTPLIDETNALLEAQDIQMREARDRAGDLAHGLKTPLAVMSAKSRQLSQAGQGAIAVEIDRQVQAMNQHVKRELARTRTRGSPQRSNQNVDVSALTDALVSIMQGLPRGQDLTWTCDLPPRLVLPVDVEDFNTLAGNLIENAQKWAVSQVRVIARSTPDGAELVVEDDGPGIADADKDRVMQRGERADESMSGSGLGLAIVNDIVARYKGALVLSRSTLGGLKAVATLPL